MRNRIIVTLGGALVAFAALGTVPAQAAAQKVTVDEECGTGWSERAEVQVNDGPTYRFCTIP